MTVGKYSLEKKKHLSLSLFISLVAACGSETPAFQEKAMSALIADQQASPRTFETESADNTAASADATVATSESNAQTSGNTVQTFSGTTETAPDDGLKVDVKESQLRFGSQSTSISSMLDGEKTSDVTYTVSAPAGKDPGKIVGNSYVSPSVGTEAYEVKITAVSKTNPSQSSSTTVKLEPAAVVFVGCTNDAKGFPIKADVFTLPENTQELPDFATAPAKTATACMDSFQIPNRAWSDGFPGHPELIEWFAVRASSHINTSKNGKYYFKLNADDGAKLYIDGQLVVDNDGLHAQQAVTGQITLAAGDHELVMEYFQGPRYHIALELFWKVPGTSSFVYVPATAFKP